MIVTLTDLLPSPLAVETLVNRLRIDRYGQGGAFGFSPVSNDNEIISVILTNWTKRYEDDSDNRLVILLSDSVVLDIVPSIEGDNISLYITATTDNNYRYLVQAGLPYGDNQFTVLSCPPCLTPYLPEVINETS